MKSKGAKITLIIILAIIVIALINFMMYAIINKDKGFNVRFSLITFGDNTEKIFEKELWYLVLAKTLNEVVSISMIFILSSFLK